MLETDVDVLCKFDEKESLMLTFEPRRTDTRCYQLWCFTLADRCTRVDMQLNCFLHCVFLLPLLGFRLCPGCGDCTDCVESTM